MDKQSNSTTAMAITESNEAVAGFAAVLETGQVISLREPSGRCVEWASRRWIGGSIADKSSP